MMGSLFGMKMGDIDEIVVFEPKQIKFAAESPVAPPLKPVEPQPVPGREQAIEPAVEGDQALIEEARKFGTVDRFVKAKQKGYYQHKLIKGKENVRGILETGFKGKGANVLPVLSGEPTNIIEKAYAPKKGDMILLVPKSQVDNLNSPRPLSVKQGFRPQPHEIVEIEYDNQTPLEVQRRQLSDVFNKSRQAPLAEPAGEIEPEGVVPTPEAPKPILKPVEPTTFEKLKLEPKIGKRVRETAGITKPFGEKKLSEKQALYLSLRSQARGAKLGFREGKEKATRQIKSAKEILDRRRSMIKSIQKDYALSDNDLKKVSNRDIRLMNNYEFKTYLDDIDAKAAAMEIKREAKINVLSEIHEKEFQKLDNLRKFMKLPTLDNMSTKQLEEFNAEMEKYQKGDEFLSVRQLETVKNTELGGIKTAREANEVLAKELNVPVSELKSPKTNEFDKYKFDAALADKDPFYGLMVDKTNTSFMESSQKFYEYETEVDELVKKARASKSRNLVERAIPSDEIVFNWLEAKPAEKASLTNQMTDAEIDLASYLQARFAQFRDYLTQQGTLEKYREDYITHIRRDFLEAWKEDGVLSAFKDIVKQGREDAAVFKILEDDTQNILPLEKFFQFAMQRTGTIKPSKNVAKAFKAYAGAMLKKQALDKIMPTLDIYAHSLSPKAVTPRGLEMDRRLKKFVKEWINNKKGRRSSIGGFIPQGGVIDIGLRAINTFVTMIDLGANVPVGMAATAGEQAVTYTNLGKEKYALGVSRMATSKGKKIIEDNRGFIGKSLWRDLTDTANNIGDTFSKGLFGLFHVSTSAANKVHLLGSLTEAEWASGKISNERKGALVREMGRYRAIPGSASIGGSTSLGKSFTKYKTWAIPVLRTNVRNLIDLTKMASKGKFKESVKSREFKELFRAATLTSAIAVTGLAVFDDDDDDGFLNTLLRKTHREALTLVGAMNPALFTSEPRIVSFLADLGKAIEMIIKLEEYKTKPGYKGVAQVKRILTPRVVKTIIGKEEQKKPKRIFKR